MPGFHCCLFCFRGMDSAISNPCASRKQQQHKQHNLDFGQDEIHEHVNDLTAAVRTVLDLRQSRDFISINMVTLVTPLFSLKYTNLPYPAFSVETKRKQDYAEYYGCVNNHLFAFRILYVACDLVCMCRALSN